MAEPLGRGRALTGLSNTITGLGGDPSEVFEQAGLETDPANEPEEWLPFRKILVCYELAAKLSGASDFGLKLATARDFSFLGPLALILRYAPDFRTALVEFNRYVSIQQTSAWQGVVHESGHDVRYEFLMEKGFRSIANQWIEESALTTIQTARIFLGPNYVPEVICFRHMPISSIRTYRQYFGVEPEFQQETDALEFRSEELSTPNRGKDHDVLALTTSMLAEQTRWSDKHIVDNVRSLIRRFLPTGKYSLEIIADQLNMDKRTLQRRLSAQNSAYGKLLDSTRRALAQDLLLEGNLPLSSVAYYLGYRDQSTFNHRFRRWFGMSPKQWLTSNYLDKGPKFLGPS